MLVLQGQKGMPDGVSLIAGALGIELLEAVDLADAQSICLASQPGILLLPAEFSGQPTLPFMQSCLEWAPGTQAIMLVERDQINAAAEAMRVGILGCLFLPFSTERLAKTLAAALGRLGVDIPRAELDRICAIATPPPTRPSRSDPPSAPVPEKSI